MLLNKVVTISLLVAAAAIGLAACDSDALPVSGAREEARQTTMASDQVAVAIGFPAIKNFFEKQLLKMIYEMRDDPKLITYTYTLDMNGKRHKVCPTTSIGYGMPYATQYTAALAPKWLSNTGHYEIAMVPQPEPNALHMPSSADGTWVLCLNPETKKLAPTYSEPRIIVYTFEMPTVD